MKRHLQSRGVGGSVGSGKGVVREGRFWTKQRRNLVG